MHVDKIELYSLDLKIPYMWIQLYGLKYNMIVQLYGNGLWLNRLVALTLEPCSRFFWGFSLLMLVQLDLYLYFHCCICIFIGVFVSSLLYLYLYFHCCICIFIFIVVFVFVSLLYLCLWLWHLTLFPRF